MTQSQSKGKGSYSDPRLEDGKDTCATTTMHDAVSEDHRVIFSEYPLAQTITTAAGRLGGLALTVALQCNGNKYLTRQQRQ